jgi:hypothetical protein
VSTDIQRSRRLVKSALAFPGDVVYKAANVAIHGGIDELDA